jgi:thiamine pyrophosphokinase
LTNQGRARRALVVADGDVPPAEEIADLLRPNDATLVVAADGGLLKAEQLGLRPHLVVGDADSLAPETIAGLAARGIELQRHDADKEASDTELALREALRRGAREVVVLGALGGLRFEHSLANVLLLALPELEGHDAALIDGRTTVRLVSPGWPLELAGRAGELVSLLPLSGEVTDVHTAGLRYALAGATLRQGPSLGLSNVMTAERASVSVGGGRLAVVHTRLAADDVPVPPTTRTNR